MTMAMAMMKTMLKPSGAMFVVTAVSDGVDAADGGRLSAMPL